MLGSSPLCLSPETGYGLLQVLNGGQDDLVWQCGMLKTVVDSLRPPQKKGTSSPLPVNLDWAHVRLTLSNCIWWQERGTAPAEARP